MVAREGPQQPVQRARLIHELLKARPDALGDPQRFAGRGAEHREQRRNHEHEQQHERRDRRQRLAATKPAEQPLIHRVAHAREDRRQHDRQQEHPDHGHERGRDRGDEQKEKGLAEARLCHGEAGAAGDGAISSNANYTAR